MKNNIKNHGLIFIILIFSLVGVFYSAFQYMNNQAKVEDLKIEWVNYCQSDKKNLEDIESCEQFLLNYNQEKNIKVDFFTMMTDILIYKLHFFNAFAFLMLIVPTLLPLSKILKNKFAISFCTRDSYNSFLKEYFKEAYRYVWLLPVISGCLILICMFSTTFDPAYAIKYGSSMWKTDIIYHPIVFIMLYLINIFLYSCAFINLALIIVRKQHNYIKAIILSFVSYIGLELFLEVVVNALILQNLFHTDIGHLFNIMNLFTFSDVFGTIPLMSFTLFVFIISMIGVYLSYKNKESIIVDCEKNND